MPDITRYLGEIIRHAPGSLAGGATRRAIGAVLRAVSIVGKGGHGRIEGTVTVAGTAAIRLVRCYDLATGMLVDQVWSAADGSWVFDYLDQTRRYQIVAHDHNEIYNAAVADTITPGAMPT